MTNTATTGPRNCTCGGDFTYDTNALRSATCDDCGAKWAPTSGPRRGSLDIIITNGDPAEALAIAHATVDRNCPVSTGTFDRHGNTGAATIIVRALFGNAAEPAAKAAEVTQALAVAGITAEVTVR